MNHEAKRCDRCMRRVKRMRVLGDTDTVLVDARDFYLGERELRDAPRVYIHSLLPGYVEPASATTFGRSRDGGRKGPFLRPHSDVCGK